MHVNIQNYTQGIFYKCSRKQTITINIVLMPMVPTILRAIRFLFTNIDLQESLLNISEDFDLIRQMREKV